MRTTTDLLTEIARLKQENARLLKVEAGLRAELLKNSQTKMRLQGHCRVCEYVPEDLKPHSETATERFHNGG